MQSWKEESKRRIRDLRELPKQWYLLSELYPELQSVSCGKTEYIRRNTHSQCEYTPSTEIIYYFY